MNIKGKVAIVTGASGGIGKAVAKQLGDEGATVVLASRNKSKLDSLAKEIPGSISIVTDVTKRNEVTALISKTEKRFGKINILINNAGRGYDESVEKTDPGIFRKLIELDLLGPLQLMQEVIPVMKRQKSGTIINISSGTSLMYLPEMSAYSGTKRALNGLSLTAREELKGSGITVSVYYPYITATDFEKNMFRGRGKPDISKENGHDDHGLPPADSAEFVAGKIITLIKSGEAEGYSHDWMKERFQ